MARMEGWGAQETQASEARVLSPCPPPALASGCPRRGPTQSTSVVPFGCNHCRALAQMSTCGSVTSMAGKKVSASDLAALGRLACPCWATLPARTSPAGQGITLLHTATSRVLGPQTGGLTWSQAPASSIGSTASLPPGLRGEEVGTLEVSCTSSVILVPGEPHFDLLFVIKVHILNALSGPVCEEGR